MHVPKGLMYYNIKEEICGICSTVQLLFYVLKLQLKGLLSYCNLLLGNLLQY